MKKFNMNFITNFKQYTKNREPDFNNILKILNKEKPSRYTLFEFFLNLQLEQFLTNRNDVPDNNIDLQKLRIDAARIAGYDYCTMLASSFYFEHNANQHGKKSLSVNESAIITDRESFKNYTWHDPEDFDNDDIDILGQYMPNGMKIISQGPNGVLENVTFILGYEGICFLLADDPELLQEIFDSVGSRLVRYYKTAAKHDSIGAFISNDDWGFATQTMLSPKDMEKYVFPWHKKIVETIHESGRPAILHSCGCLTKVYDNIINDMKFDGKHSYEDKIQPVEEAYKLLYPKLAVLGGIDLDYVCSKSLEEIYERSCNLLTLTRNTGGYGLGSGNSIPGYVPINNYLAMISAAIVNNY